MKQLKNLRWFQLRLTIESIFKAAWIHLKRNWMILLLLVLYPLGMVALVFLPTDKTLNEFCPFGNLILKDFKGNLVAGLITSLLFFLMAYYFNKEMENNVKAIKEIEAERKTLLDEERDFLNFEQTFRKHTFCDIQVEGDVDKNYQIQVVKNPDGSLRTFKSLDNDHYIIKVVDPAHARGMSDSEKEEYDNSEIKIGEYYLCRHFAWVGEKATWKLSQEPIPHNRKWYPFYLQGTVSIGRGGNMRSANEVMGVSVVDSTKYTEAFRIMLQEDGSPNPKGRNSGHLYQVFKDSKGGFFLQVNKTSPLKRIFLSDTEEHPKDRRLVIREFGGYGNSDKRERIKKALVEEAEKMNVQFPYQRL